MILILENAASFTRYGLYLIQPEKKTAIMCRCPKIIYQFVGHNKMLLIHNGAQKIEIEVFLFQNYQFKLY